MDKTNTELLGSIIFGIAVLHTFSVKLFQHLARRFKEGSVGENFFHLLGEIEIVFGLWAGLLITMIALSNGVTHAVQLVESVNFTEPLFVFAIMTVAATRPVLNTARSIINTVSRVGGTRSAAPFYFVSLVLGPLLGSLITEPAAMTVTALILRDRYFKQGLSERFMYLTLGVLFVNISIGGVLTPFAAPPVLMVANTWNWDLGFMLTQFGWKASLATLVNATLATWILRKELRTLPAPPRTSSGFSSPVWLQMIHLLVLALIVSTSHHPAVFLGLLLFFLGIADITREYQDELKLKESLLVAFFLGGLVILGRFQSWWLKPLLENLTEFPLFLGATALTAITDNAALTYLGSQVPGLSDKLKYALVAGAVAGGGLTVIANAPNPAGFSILKESFGPEGISPIRVFLGALIPTIVAMLFFWIF